MNEPVIPPHLVTSIRDFLAWQAAAQTLNYAGDQWRDDIGDTAVDIVTALARYVGLTPDVEYVAEIVEFEMDRPDLVATIPDVLVKESEPTRMDFWTKATG